MGKFSLFLSGLSACDRRMAGYYHFMFLFVLQETFKIELIDINIQVYI